jgi:glycosyltransferase involved in cell wall biosynthesis
MTALVDMIGVLDRARFEPVVLLHTPTDYSDRFRGLDVKVRVLPGDPPRRHSPAPVTAALEPLRRLEGLRQVRRLARTELPLARRIARVLAEEGPDLVHHNDNPRADRASIIAARMVRVPQVCHVRYQRGYYRPLDRLLSAWVAHYIFVSQSVEQAFHEAVGVRPRKGRTSYEAVDFSAHLALEEADRRELREELGLGAGEPVVVNVGRVVPWKGHDVFLDAIAAVAQRHEDVRAVIVGSPADSERGRQWLDALRDRMTHLGIRERVLITGFRPDVHRFYAAADVVVHSATRPEPFGRVVVEAMAAARPVIATAAGGVPEIIRHGVTGLLVPPSDSRGVAEAICQILDHAEAASAMGRHARADVQRRFPKDRFGQDLMALYESLLTRVS